MTPSKFSVPIPQEVIVKAERAVARTGLFPDWQSLASEAILRMRVTLESKGTRVLDAWIPAYGANAAGAGIQSHIVMPSTVFKSLSKLSESTGENLFAMAVVMHLDRLHQLRRV